MIKKFIACILIFNILTTFALENKIMLLHMAGRGSIQETEMQWLGKNLTAKKIDVEYFAPGDCAEPTRMWNQDKTRPMIMHYSTGFANQERMFGKHCTADLTGATVLMSRPQPNWLCSAQNSRSFNTNNLRVGIYSTAPGEDQVADLNKLNHLTWRHIPIKSTNDGLIALANGDIDYFLVAKSVAVNKIKDKSLVCYASTVRYDALPYLGNLFKSSGDLETSSHPIHIIVAKNLTLGQLTLVKNLLDPTQNSEYQDILSFQNSQVESVADGAQALDNFKNRANLFLETYKK